MYIFFFFWGNFFLFRADLKRDQWGNVDLDIIGAHERIKQRKKANKGV